MFNRRSFIAAASTTAAVIAAAPDVFAQAAPAGPFKLDPLPYAYDALQASIDRQTMELHHDKHHATYVANLNAAAKEAPQIAQMPMEKILADLNAVPESVRTMVRNNMGGNVNHMMYWQVMGANGGAPTGDLLAAIDRDLGGLAKLQTDFNTAGTKIFGSGWVFVTVTKEGNLAIETRPNQDTPLMDGKRVLFGNDVWEHAYYLKYQNRRLDFLKAWWDVVSWSKVGDRFDQARQGMLLI